MYSCKSGSGFISKSETVTTENNTTAIYKHIRNKEGVMFIQHPLNLMDASAATYLHLGSLFTSMKTQFEMDWGQYLSKS